MIYNKLVRDKIPEFIVKHGGNPKSHIAEDDEYHHKLLEKMDEEFNEFKEDENLEEYVDMLEVLEAIAEYKGFKKDEIEDYRNTKAKERGRFKNRIILDEA
jgi:predicted house-cleaning noncanonical NTP pyrophosphatase (MazG superfamily)